MQPTQLALVALIAFAAAFVQSVAGFGSALLGMPLLVAVVGIQIASPLVAMLQALNAIRSRDLRFLAYLGIYPRKVFHSLLRSPLRSSREADS